MLTQTTITGSDDWWLMREATDLGADFPRLFKLQSYADGTNGVPSQASPQMAAAYAQFVKRCRLNFADTIVSAVTARQTPVGFRTAAAADEDGDKVAMATFKKSHLDVYGKDVFEDVGTFGRGYTLNDGQGQILRLSPWNAFTESSPMTPWSPDAGIMVGFDPVEQADIITLFRPAGTAADGSTAPAYSRRAVKLVKRVTSIPSNGNVWTPGNDWDWIEDPQPITWLQDVPLVDYVARKGMGQYEAHIDTLDRINQTILDRLTITAMQAFRQRAVTGELPETYPSNHPLAGQRVNYNDVFQAGPAALWILPTGADIWESQVTDITAILSAVDKDLKYLAAVSSTPLYILSPDAASGSAAGADLADAMLNAKVKDLNVRMGISLDRAMAQSFAAQGDTTRSDASQIETMFAEPDELSWAEKAAAAAQAVTSMSRKAIAKYIYGLTPSQIEEEEQNWSDQTFEQAALGVPAAAAPAVTKVSVPAAIPAPAQPVPAPPRAVTSGKR